MCWLAARELRRTKKRESAMERLKRAPNAGKPASVGPFLAQLESQRKTAKSPIKARPGNQVYFTSLFLQLAPAPDPAKGPKIGALPRGSRIKVHPWNDSVTLMKTQERPPIFPREKVPFEVASHLTYFCRFRPKMNTPSCRGRNFRSPTLMTETDETCGIEKRYFADGGYFGGISA